MKETKDQTEAIMIQTRKKYTAKPYQSRTDIF